MFTDATPEQLKAEGVGRAQASHLGERYLGGLSPAERQRVESTLPQVAMRSPGETRYTQATVSPETSDHIPMDRLTSRMREDGWQGKPVDVVRWGDGSCASIDNRRLVAANRTDVDQVPQRVHNPNEPIQGEDWSPGRRNAIRLTTPIYERPDGTVATGHGPGRLLHPVGSKPRTYGEAAMFRAANQEAKTGEAIPLWGTDREPRITRGGPRGSRRRE